MSEKMSVPTFQVVLTGSSEIFEGPIVAPDKCSVAKDMIQFHNIVKQHGSILIYTKQWMYVPSHSIHHVLRGKQFFNLPWPLVTEEVAPS